METTTNELTMIISIVFVLCLILFALGRMADRQSQLSSFTAEMGGQMRGAKAEFMFLGETAFLGFEGDPNDFDSETLDLVLHYRGQMFRCAHAEITDYSALKEIVLRWLDDAVKDTPNDSDLSYS